jgi:hypothetical protein
MACRLPEPWRLVARKISDHYSEDGVKRALILKEGSNYSIKFYLNESFFHEIKYENKSIYFVESAAFNYTSGVFNNVKNFS